GNRVFYIQDRANLAAQTRAIRMRHSAWLVDKDPQHARLASAPQLDLYHFETQGSRHTLRYCAYVIQINCHRNSDLAKSRRPENSLQQKVGLRPLVCSANPGTTQQSSP